MTPSQERVFREGWQRLQGACQLDHSVSVAQLGSLFTRHGDKPLQQLKRQLADAYDVVWSFPSTQGTTTLNTLALLSACPAGGRVLVNRDAHTSATAAMVQGGLQPVYLVPEYDSDLGLCLDPTLAGFKEVLRREQVDCVFLTSPNYFGIVGELAEIVSFAHEQGLPVVVDAAHAPHFHFCKSLPQGAEDLVQGVAGPDNRSRSHHRDRNRILPVSAHVGETTETTASAWKGETRETNHVLRVGSPRGRRSWAILETEFFPERKKKNQKERNGGLWKMTRCGNPKNQDSHSAWKSLAKGARLSHIYNTGPTVIITTRNY